MTGVKREAWGVQRNMCESVGQRGWGEERGAKCYSVQENDFGILVRNTGSMDSWIAGNP